MNKRKLKRQLNLVQVVMLGTAGAIGAQIFVLTGHAAGMIGPAFVLAIILGGLLSYSIALNYGELASSFPETGGAMTYVLEAWVLSKSRSHTPDRARPSAQPMKSKTGSRKVCVFATESKVASAW